ncbi:MAG: phytanoyl-CoA dioxygenase family protein [Pseudomonadota bacterium]
MNVEHVKSHESVERIHEFLERDGCVVIDNLISEVEVDAILNELAPHLSRTPYGSDPFDGYRTRRTGSLVARAPSSHPVIMQPTILGVADRALAHATTYQLHCTQVIAVGPSSDAQMLHRDQWAFDLFPFPQGFDTTFSTMWAMSDFTEANGATRVIPGSHKHADKLEYALDDSVAAEMSKGSVLLYTGSLYHGAGPNVTQHDRLGMIVHYSLGWLRQEENQYLGTPPEVLATLPEDMLRLMGYDHGSYSLGFIDGGVDPMAAVRPELVRASPELPEDPVVTPVKEKSQSA